MAIKTWARLDGSVIVELLSIDSALVPGEDIPVLWTDDVSSVKGVRAGWTKGGNGSFSAPPAPSPLPPVVPASISRRQFFQQLAVQSVITQTEALAAVQTGAIPSEMQPLIDGLPSADRFGAEMMISGATEFLRTDPLTLELGAAKGWSSSQIDELWTAAGAL